MRKGKRSRAHDHAQVDKVGWQPQKEFYVSGGMKQKVSAGLPSLGKRNSKWRNTGYKNRQKQVIEKI